MCVISVMRRGRGGGDGRWATAWTSHVLFLQLESETFPFPLLRAVRWRIEIKDNWLTSVGWGHASEQHQSIWGLLVSAGPENLGSLDLSRTRVFGVYWSHQDQIIWGLLVTSGPEYLGSLGSSRTRLSGVSWSHQDQSIWPSVHPTSHRCASGKRVQTKLCGTALVLFCPRWIGSGPLWSRYSKWWTTEIPDWLLIMLLRVSTVGI